MGVRPSRPIAVTFEDAVKKLSFAEQERIYLCFEKHKVNENLTLETFSKEVLSAEAPCILAKLLFDAFGATPKGLSFKKLVIGLVTVARGDLEERARFLFDIFSSNNEYISRSDMFQSMRTLENGQTMQLIHRLFTDNSTDRISFEMFFKWALLNQKSLNITEWLLDQPFKLSGNSKCNNFYEILSGITHLDESEIVSIEKQYRKWVNYQAGKLTLEQFKCILAPFMPDNLLEGFFFAFDENLDGQIDFKEMICGISACCRGPQVERLKFIFKMLDRNRTGYAAEDNLLLLVNGLHKNSTVFTSGSKGIDGIKSDLGNKIPVGQISLDDFCMWAVQTDIFDALFCLLYQICHIIFGLQPNSKNDEKLIVLEWMKMEQNQGFKVEQVWYLISKVWWRQWENWVDSEEIVDHTKRLNQPFNTARFVRSHSQSDSLISGSGESHDSGSSHGNKNGPVGCATEDKTFLLIENGAKTNEFIVSNESGFESETSSCTNTCNKGRREEKLLENEPVLHFSSKISNVGAEASKYRQSPTTSLRNWSPCPRNLPDSELIVEFRVPSKPGPIDNSQLVVSSDDWPSSSRLVSLTLEGGVLKPGYANSTEQHNDFIAVSDVLWKALTRWYRGGSPALPRNVMLNNTTGQYKLEFYPTMVTMLRHQQINSGRLHSNHAASLGTALFFGAPLNYGDYSSSVSAPMNHCMINRVPMYTAAFSKTTKLGDVFRFIRQRLNLNPEATRFWFLNCACDDYNASTVTLLEDESSRLEDLELIGKVGILVESRNSDLTWPEELLSLTKNRQAASRYQPCERGLTGLTNLGNTCFMNSALQCISNTQPLTQYFSRNVHLYELNKDNKLGVKGQMALQYGNLVKDLWSGNTKITAPLKLRFTVCKYAPTFNDLNQHDCQELLSFLLDGLHEDLNRVQQKVYKELKDSDGRPDDIVAAEAWENHLRRNQSIVVDLFHGLLKSAVTCSVCKSVSVKFDPFTFLSLPLPLDNNIFIRVVVVRLDGSRPIKYGLRLASDQMLFHMKDQLSQLCGIAENQLLMLRLNSQFYIEEYLENATRLKNFPTSILYAFELPAFDWMKESLNEKNDSQHLVVTEAQTKCSLGLHRSASSVQSRSDSFFGPHYNRSLSSVKLDASPGLRRVPTENFLPKNFRGLAIGIQRRMERKDCFFVAHHQYKPVVFGLPLILASDVNQNSWSAKWLYENVRLQLSRFIATVPKHKLQINHAQNGDEDLYSEYPFKLKTVSRKNNFIHCSKCPWFKFCVGCEIECEADTFLDLSDCFVAIDWDITAWHLRYAHSIETEIDEHKSVKEAFLTHTEPITLDSCLKAFTQPEELNDRDNYFCSKCKAHCPASKKLDIWRLPPILIVHFKRFQYGNERWMKSCKLVDFPLQAFDPSKYLTAFVQPPPTVDPPPLRPQPARRISASIDQGHIFQLNDSCHTNASDCEAKYSENQDCVDSVTSTPKFCSAENHETSRHGFDRNCAFESNGEILEESQTPGHSGMPTLPCGQHGHKLKGTFDQLDLKYDLYAIAGHQGVMGYGHYITYARNINEKWYLYNDSSCKQIDPKNIDSSLAYILFYERRGLDYGQYIPDFTGKTPENSDATNQIEPEIGYNCSLQ